MFLPANRCFSNSRVIFCPPVLPLNTMNMVISASVIWEVKFNRSLEPSNKRTGNPLIVLVRYVGLRDEVDCVALFPFPEISDHELTGLPLERPSVDASSHKILSVEFPTPPGPDCACSPLRAN